MVVVLLDFFGKKRVDWGLSKQICVGCPVRRECLSYALQARMVHGVWGGLDPLELRFTLGRDASGALWTYTRQDVKCPLCRGATDVAEVSESSAVRKCMECDFSWIRAERQKVRRRRRQ